MPQRRIQYKRKQRQTRRKMMGMGNSVDSYVRTGRAIYQGAKLAAGAHNLYTYYKKNGKKTLDLTKFGGSKSKKVVSRVNAPYQSGGYNQWQEQGAKVNIGKSMTLLSQLARKMKQSETKVLYKFQGVKNFDDNGYYWLGNSVVADRRYLPFYALDLTSCVNIQKSSATIVNSYPLQRCYMVSATGDIYFDNQQGVLNDGLTTDYFWTPEQTGGSGTAIYQPGNIAYDTPSLPHSKDILKWASINFNLWGAKAKSTKYVAQIVQFSDDALIPFSGAPVNTKRTSFYQSLLKQYVFNPISTNGVNVYKKYIKVVKSETFNIGPTSTTESDADPHVKTVKWYVKLNKMLDYVQTANNLTTSTDFADQADYPVNLGNQNDAYVQANKRMYFILYATNFGLDAGDTNVETPSFDISVRKCHVHLD